MNENHEYKSAREVAAYAGPGRQVIAMVEGLAGDRQRTTRARDRGDTMIEIARMITAQGGQARVEAEEADGAKFSLNVVAPPPALDDPDSPKAVYAEVLSPAAELEPGDGSRAE